MIPNMIHQITQKYMDVSEVCRYAPNPLLRSSYVYPQNLAVQDIHQLIEWSWNQLNFYPLKKKYSIPQYFFCQYFDGQYVPQYFSTVLSQYNPDICFQDTQRLLDNDFWCDYNDCPPLINHGWHSSGVYLIFSFSKIIMSILYPKYLLVNVYITMERSTIFNG